MSISTDHIKDSLRKKVDQVLEDFVEAVDVFNQHELTGNITLTAHLNQGAMMKGEIDYHYGIKFK